MTFFYVSCKNEFSGKLEGGACIPGCSRQGAAELAGINKRTLDNYLREKANTPPADVAVKIAHALNVSVEYLVTGVEAVTADKPSEVVELLSIKY
ncbi:MAG: helix-turn-helix transcriptional regulator [Spirochaetaceae bacterium]|nr:helix-turn-helix transcriptional regulator [Spirochaetaceae bacterium]MBQ8560331.1 helix-turn-helix transcriptional regulator [Spirochaetaceae bacterium]